MDRFTDTPGEIRHYRPSVEMTGVGPDGVRRQIWLDKTEAMVTACDRAFKRGVPDLAQVQLAYERDAIDVDELERLVEAALSRSTVELPSGGVYWHAPNRPSWTPDQGEDWSVWLLQGSLAAGPTVAIAFLVYSLIT